ncbi:hypothetical protein D3C72_2194280 [compost metagenome]
MNDRDSSAYPSQQTDGSDHLVVGRLRVGADPLSRLLPLQFIRQRPAVAIEGGQRSEALLSNPSEPLSDLMIHDRHLL